jgi:peptidoglycan/xylan/chitin deacetylase (PgdA/CDA1 family)
MDERYGRVTLQPARRRSSRMTRALPCVIPFVLGLCVVGCEAIGLFAQLGWLTPAPPAATVWYERKQEAFEVTPSLQLEAITHRFMEDMLRKNWRAMWSLLHPDAMLVWQGERNFLAFEQAKYGALAFTAYRLGPPGVHYSWRDPHTTKIYSAVVVMTASLAAAAPAGLLSPPSSFALSHGLFAHTQLALVQDHSVWRVLLAGPADVEAPILVPARPTAHSLMVPIFMYHHVTAQPTLDLFDYNLTVTANDFDQQLGWLQQHGYHSISETELFDAMYYGKALPSHPMLLTFDDGYEDMYTDAYPLLLSHQDRGIFNIVTGMIGGRYLTWQQIHEMAGAGMQIASHTIHHVNVGQPPAGTSTQVELLDSKRTLERQLGQPVQFFCYPSGEPFHHDTAPQQQLVLADLYRDGYVGATLDPFSFFTAIQREQIPYQLQRIRVSGGESLEMFVGILNATLSDPLLD